MFPAESRGRKPLWISGQKNPKADDITVGKKIFDIIINNIKFSNFISPVNSSMLLYSFNT